jgi:hypothetical protein
MGQKESLANLEDKRGNEFERYKGKIETEISRIMTEKLKINKLKEEICKSLSERIANVIRERIKGWLNKIERGINICSFINTSTDGIITKQCNTHNYSRFVLFVAIKTDPNVVHNYCA